MAGLRVLVVDDESEIRELLVEALTTWGYDATAASDGVSALAAIAGELFDVALLDITMPKLSGIEVLREIKRRDLGVDVLMMTGRPTVATAVDALRLGAYDYLEKPLNYEELRHLVGRMAEQRLLRREVGELRHRLAEGMPSQDLVGVSAAMERVMALVEQVATSSSAVLIEGESGTGKELLAVAIHRRSLQHKGPFVPVNCGAIPHELMESQFFGHVRGAFSGAVADSLGLFRSAHGGTLFLDEIGELSPALQVKLLRVLQDKEVRPVGAVTSHRVDVRVIAATNRDVDEAVRADTLREDLFYRLSVVRIVVPPLRERKEDIPVLAAHFLRQLNQRFGRQIHGLTRDALAALRSYDFPGNARELENLLERAYALGARGEITGADLPALQRPTRKRGQGLGLPTLAEAERDLIVKALSRQGGNRDQAALALGISSRTLYRRLKGYHLL